jgi:hypothetical protein
MQGLELCRRISGIAPPLDVLAAIASEYADCRDGRRACDRL